MKASAVTQSFKALASRFNNQVPLGAKESNQLLTAITNSFRKHLDEIHPSQPYHDELEEKRHAASKEGRRLDGNRYESSAALADKHMASLLTNPLLVNNATRHTQQKPELDATTAKNELKNGAEPFDLLEAYHAKGFATIEVALSCMQHFRRSIKDLQYSAQVEIVEEKQAGKRALAWLYDSGLLQSSAFTENTHFQDGFVWLAMMEGLEDLLWQLLESDLGLISRLPKKDPKKHSPNHAWPGRIIYAMVMTKLGSLCKEARSADAALEIYFQALQHTETHIPFLRDKYVLSTARVALVRALSRGPAYSQTNSSLYDKFTRVCADAESSDSQTAAKTAWVEFRQAQLNLWHPSYPTADKWYSAVTRTASNSTDHHIIQEHLAEPKDGQTMAQHLRAFKRAVSLLNTAGKYDESNELLSLARKLYPSKASDILGNQPTTSPQREQRGVDHKQQQEHDWLAHYFPATT